jgi:predicted HTH transcriptional regulator
MNITTKELAERLGIPYVHAASLIKTMIHLGVAKKIGTISSGGKGRATVQYELTDSDGIVRIELDLSRVGV